MTFHQLEIFEAVAEQLNITTASRKIRISQPSVSKQLRLLEQECGLKLYVKCGRGIRVTEEGRLFQAAAKPIQNAAGLGVLPTMRLFARASAALCTNVLFNRTRGIHE